MRKLLMLMAVIFLLTPSSARAEDNLDGLTVIYVSAFDCPICKSINVSVIPNLKSKWAGKIKFVNFQFPTLRDLRDPSIWGQYLFVRDQYNVESSTPRFYLLKDNRSLMQLAMMDGEIHYLDLVLDEAALPKLTEPAGVSGAVAEDWFLAYQIIPGPKAFAVASTGQVAIGAHVPTIERAKADALSYCKSYNGKDCRIVFVGRAPVE